MADTGSPADTLRERRPTPEIAPGRCVTGTYVDNVQVVGGCRGDVTSRMGKIGDSFSRALLPFDVSDINETTLQTLGLVYHWGERRLRHVPRRVWRTYLAAGALLKRRKLLGRTLAVWMGHAVNLMQLCPEAMSSFSACYRFVTEAADGALRVWPSVRGEIRCAMHLLFLLEADLSSRFNPEVYCGDASDRGHGLLVTQAPGRQIREAWRWRERWRYSDVATEKMGVGADCVAAVRGGVCGTGLGRRHRLRPRVGLERQRGASGASSNAACRARARPHRSSQHPSVGRRLGGPGAVPLDLPRQMAAPLGAHQLEGGASGTPWSPALLPQCEKFGPAVADAV